MNPSPSPSAAWTSAAWTTAPFSAQAQHEYPQHQTHSVTNGPAVAMITDIIRYLRFTTTVASLSASEQSAINKVWLLLSTSGLSEDVIVQVLFHLTEGKDIKVLGEEYDTACTYKRLREMMCSANVNDGVAVPIYDHFEDVPQVVPWTANIPQFVAWGTESVATPDEDAMEAMQEGKEKECEEHNDGTEEDDEEKAVRMQLQREMQASLAEGGLAAP